MLFFRDDFGGTYTHGKLSRTRQTDTIDMFADTAETDTIDLGLTLFGCRFVVNLVKTVMTTTVLKCLYRFPKPLCFSTDPRSPSDDYCPFSQQKYIQTLATVTFPAHGGRP